MGFNKLAVIAVTVTGAHQTTPINVYAEDTNTSDPITLQATTDKAECLLFGVSANNSETPTAGASETERASLQIESSSTRVYVTSKEASSSGTQTMTHDLVASALWGMGIIAINNPTNAYTATKTVTTTLSADPIKGINSIVSATVTLAGTRLKQIGSYISASLSLAANNFKQDIAKILSSSLTLLGSFIRGRTLDASITLFAARLTAMAIYLEVTSTLTATNQKFTNLGAKAVSAILSSSFVKSINNIVNNALYITSIGAIFNIKKYVTATINLTQDVIKSINSIINSSLTLSSVLFRKTIGRLFEATITISTGLGKVINILITSTINLSASILKNLVVVAKSASLTLTNSLQKQISLFKNKTISLTTSIGQFISIIVSSTITLTSVVIREIIKSVSLALTSAILKDIQIIKNCTIFISISANQFITFLITVTTTLTASVTKLANKIISKTLTLTLTRGIIKNVVRIVPKIWKIFSNKKPRNL